MSQWVSIGALFALMADAGLMHYWSGSGLLLYGIRLGLGVGVLAALLRIGVPRKDLGFRFSVERADLKKILWISLVGSALYALFLLGNRLFPNLLGDGDIGIDFVDASGAWNYLWTALLLAPLVEELIYRGLVVSALRENLPSWAVILASGVLFYLLHLSYGKDWRLLHYLPAGMILTWVFLATKKLWIPILLHFLGNVLMGIDDLLRLLSK